MKWLLNMFGSHLNTYAFQWRHLIFSIVVSVYIIFLLFEVISWKCQFCKLVNTTELSDLEVYCSYISEIHWCCLTDCKSNYDSWKRYLKVFKFPKKQVDFFYTQKKLKIFCKFRFLCIFFEENNIIDYYKFKRKDGTIEKNLLKYSKLKMLFQQFSQTFPNIFQNLLFFI